MLLEGSRSGRMRGHYEGSSKRKFEIQYLACTDVDTLSFTPIGLTIHHGPICTQRALTSGATIRIFGFQKTMSCRKPTHIYLPHAQSRPDAEPFRVRRGGSLRC